MLKLGSYDKKTGTFSKKTKDTIAPFVDLNREALAMSIDVVVRILNKEEIDDKRLNELEKNGTFQKNICLYNNYYTLDENGEYKVPRIAIRMEYGKIGEIRGITENQNVEPENGKSSRRKNKIFS